MAASTSTVKIGFMLLTLLGCFVASATSIVLAPQMHDLAGAWLGPADSSAYFRLELDAAGQGLLVIQEAPSGGAISLYRIKSTSLSGYSVSFSLEPVSSADPTVKLSGKAYPGKLLLERSGVNHGYNWQQAVTLEREDYILPRIRAVQEASTVFRNATER